MTAATSTVSSDTSTSTNARVSPIDVPKFRNKQNLLRKYSTRYSSQSTKAEKKAAYKRKGIAPFYVSVEILKHLNWFLGFVLFIIFCLVLLYSLHPIFKEHQLTVFYSFHRNHTYSNGLCVVASSSEFCNLLVREFVSKFSTNTTERDRIHIAIFMTFCLYGAEPHRASLFGYNLLVNVGQDAQKGYETVNFLPTDEYFHFVDRYNPHVFERGSSAVIINTFMEFYSSINAQLTNLTNGTEDIRTIYDSFEEMTQFRFPISANFFEVIKHLRFHIMFGLTTDDNFFEDFFNAQVITPSLKTFKKMGETLKQVMRKSVQNVSTSQFLTEANLDGHLSKVTLDLGMNPALNGEEKTGSFHQSSNMKSETKFQDQSIETSLGKMTFSWLTDQNTNLTLLRFLGIALLNADKIAKGTKQFKSDMLFLFNSSCGQIGFLEEQKRESVGFVIGFRDGTAVSGAFGLHTEFGTGTITSGFVMDNALKINQKSMNHGVGRSLYSERNTAIAQVARAESPYLKDAFSLTLGGLNRKVSQFAFEMLAARLMKYPHSSVFQTQYMYIDSPKKSNFDKVEVKSSGITADVFTKKVNKEFFFTPIKWKTMELDIFGLVWNKLTKDVEVYHVHSNSLKTFGRRAISVL